ncbi:MAG: glucose-1-phosphate thymidylyltransferase [Nitrospinae bacterium]|nr:glucose-1-phosphate thymidylyltransferase [Nitrospinota bacterium]
MDKMSVLDFFPEMGHFAHKGLFAGLERPWDVLAKINGYISEFVGGEAETARPEGLELQAFGADWILYCTAPVVLEKNFSNRLMRVFIGAGTKIEPSAIIKGPALIGGGCEIRQGAYLRGGVLAGDGCTLGHTTEIKNSILMNHSEAGHFNYIGDSVIGSYVNLGAGTKLANLKFRTAEEKKKGSFPEITFVHDGEKVRSGVAKFGTILGDYCEVGCNAVCSPASLLYSDCKVYPNFTVRSGVYKKGSFLRP